MNMYKTIDLFAGIGGIRLGFEMTNRTQNIFSVEMDKYACQTYEANFGDNPLGDVTKIKVNDLDNFDILLAGFPCQAFSIAGRRLGFEDTRGTLFFDVARIIKHKRPKAFLLENVKGLVNHKGGKTLETILRVLENDLNYKVSVKVLNAKNYGLPQNRERIYIVGFEDENVDFKFPEYVGDQRTLRHIIEEKEVSSKYYLSDTYLQTLKAHRERHETKGNGFGYQILSYDGISNAVVVGGMGRERNLIIDDRLSDFTPKTRIKGEINKESVRSLTPREWARLQGFPDTFEIPVSDTQAYKQFGNSVAVNVIHHIAKEMISALDKAEGKQCRLKPALVI
ncbi:DNA cytosine methyltransferase [Terrihalobacillus insolitus]|uniref:DNA cytosine methyltransferase n=1 Tax=Terrihalobacillus insolitus TaxID=2950438 RepID=UPI002340A3B3|nr:DNA cytosine methyltransferase [Terrihalobacillus insolitus]MDC3412031.1 DNA cytosine methyltransferase [Terrihalobacillus insolitus]